jgi:CheY-like chemotaxis protein
VDGSSSVEIGIALLALACAGALGLALGRRTRANIPAELAAISDCVLSVASNGSLESIETPRAGAERWPRDVGSWQELVHPDDQERIREALTQSPRRSFTPVRLHTDAGEWRSGLILWRPAGSGRMRGYFRAHEAGARPAADGFGLAPFISAVTHQLNNRLHLIRGFAELSIQTGDGADTDASGIARINEVVDESAELLRQLATLATDALGTPQPLDLGEELARLANFAEPILGSRIVIRVERPPEPLVTAIAPLPLQQAVTALLILAAGNQGRRGEILLRASREASDSIAIEIVADCGDASEPVANADHANALALALDRLLACGCRLEVDSSRGVQRLRIVLGGPVAAPPGPVAARTGRGRNVLVVDASAHERAKICEILEEEGYRTWEAGNGSEAVAMADSLDALALLVVDLLLDSETGVEVRDRVEARREGVRVLYTTSFPAVLGVSADDGEHAMALAKPYKRDELIERVREALEG